MCIDCVEMMAHEIGSVLEEEDASPEIAFAALHAVARVIERQVGMSVKDMAELQYLGRDIGDGIAEEMQIPSTLDGEDEHRELIASATMLHHRNEPD